MLFDRTPNSTGLNKSNRSIWQLSIWPPICKLNSAKLILKSRRSAGSSKIKSKCYSRPLTTSKYIRLYTTYYHNVVLSKLSHPGQDASLLQVNTSIQRHQSPEFLMPKQNHQPPMWHPYDQHQPKKDEEGQDIGEKDEKNEE